MSRIQPEAVQSICTAQPTAGEYKVQDEHREREKCTSPCPFPKPAEELKQTLPLILIEWGKKVPYWGITVKFYDATDTCSS